MGEYLGTQPVRAMHGVDLVGFLGKRDDRLEFELSTRSKISTRSKGIDIRRGGAMEPMAVRQALMTCLGPFPDRVPLTPTVSTPIDEGAYTRALVTYLVEAEEQVSAWLLTP
jgi:hypothetical protein